MKTSEEIKKKIESMVDDFGTLECHSLTSGNHKTANVFNDRKILLERLLKWIQSEQEASDAEKRD